jgi:HIV Tat-specific factor 1
MTTTTSNETNFRITFIAFFLHFQIESVELALKVLDGYEVRGKEISVQRAEFQMRGEYNPALKPRMKKQEKEKMKKIQEKWVCDWIFFYALPRGININRTSIKFQFVAISTDLIVSIYFSLLSSNRLFDWRPEKMRGERAKHEKTVIIKNLFEPELFDREVHLILDYQNDLREECGKCGTVRKVVVYDVSWI